MIYIFIAWIIIIFLIKQTENFQNGMRKDSKQLVNFTHCKNCVAWNHRDARSNCEEVCGKYRHNNGKYTGNWKINDKGIDCECKYDGKLTKTNVECPKKNCFFFNNEDARKECPSICKKNTTDGLHEVQWTGTWSRKDTNISQCECSYYK